MFSPDRLKASRVLADLSRSDLHRKLVMAGVTRCRAMINRWEDGLAEPTASDLEALATALNVRIEDLFVQEKAS